MARIKKIEKVVKTESYILELSKEEAFTLIIALGEYGGCHMRSARKYSDSIIDALNEQGVTYHLANNMSEDLIHGTPVFTLIVPNLLKGWLTMAKAQKVEKVISKSEKYVLELSKEEAIAVMAVLASIGGCPRSSARKYAEPVYNVLKSEVPDRVSNILMFDEGIATYTANSAKDIEEAANG